MNGARGRRWRIAGVGLVAVGLAAVVFAARVGPAAGQDGAAVTIQGFAFGPAAVEVPVGGTVTWTNQDSAPHTATADDGSFDTGQLGQGASGSATFNTAGTFAYGCTIHPNMRGSVTVVAAAAGDAAAPATTTTTTTTAALPSTGVGAALDEGAGGEAWVWAALVGLVGLLTAVGLGVMRLR
jgi:plastocyanin